ncbi:MAG: hypothetical protein IRZ16_03050 [Myxococcaceae bacterium]|nr:hypothetical protein [Myxococcaceae bacterium]
MRARNWVALLSLAVVAACSSEGGCGGCGAFAPLPDAQRLDAPKVDHAADVRVTDGGLSVLNQNWEGILAQFAPGRVLSVPLPCTIQNVTGIGDVAIADMGSSGCASESCGLMDGVCDSRDEPRQVDVYFHGLRFEPGPPDRLVAIADLEVSTGTFYVDSVSRKHLLCLLQSPFKCGVDFDTARNAPAQSTFALQLRMTFDPVWDQLLRLEVADIDGAQVCGSGESPPDCLDPADLIITNAGSCSGVCNAGSWEPVKAVILSQVVGSLKSALQEAIDRQQCQPCSSGEPACPVFAGATSTCELDGSGSDAGICRDTDTGRCVPALFGIEGRVDSASALAPMLSTGTPKLDVSLALGGSASADTGVTVAFRGAAREEAVAPCVPALPAPAITPVPAPQLDAEAAQPYDVALSVSRAYLNQLGHHAEQSGALCVTLTTASLPVLESGLFKTLLPSLGAVQGDRDVPMAVTLRPQKPPTFRIGRGEVGEDGTLISPLVTLSMKDLELDFYAQLEERPVRLFTLVVDVNVPLALQFEGCDTVQPMIGSLEGAITVTATKNSEILAENVDDFAKLVPAFIALAEPALAQGLPTFTLPDFGAFKAAIVEAHGVNPMGATGNFEHVGLYAQLLPSSAECAGAAPSVRAQLKEARVPTEAQMLGGKTLPWPTAVIVVESNAADARYQYRVNGGFWSTLRPARADGTIEVTHPALVAEGTHRIEVRARRSGGPGVSSVPVVVPVTVDWSAPTVRFEADRLSDRLKVIAHDAVTKDEDLRFAWRVGDGPFSDFGPAREVMLSAIERAGGLTVRVRDEAGHITEATWRAPTEVERLEEASPATGNAGGCAAIPGSTPGWLALIALWRTTSRRRK